MNSTTNKLRIKYSLLRAVNKFMTMIKAESFDDSETYKILGAPS